MAEEIDPEQWLHQNPHVYQRFEVEALRIARRGRKHYSARTICEVMRHESSFQADPERSYKVNNNLIPILARTFMERHPELPGFFELRGAA